MPTFRPSRRPPLLDFSPLLSCSDLSRPPSLSRSPLHSLFPFHSLLSLHSLLSVRSLLSLLSLVSLLSLPSSRASDLSTDASSLLAFKNRLGPNNATLSWKLPTDVCRWSGIICTNGRVTALNVSDSFLTGSLAPEIGNLDRLETLLLNGNAFEGSIPESIGNLKFLRFMNLSGTFFTGSIPESLFDCVNLEQLSISTDFLNGPISERIGNLVELKVLRLSGSPLGPFSGDIPETLWSLPNLEYLDLSNNRLSGNLSPSIGNLIKLSYFSVYTNQLSGPIPPELGKLTLLRVLDLSTNDFSGELSPFLFQNCTRLTSIHIVNNRFLGPLPSTLENCENLNDFQVQNNQLNGNLSSQIDWSGFTSLTSLYLSENSFLGPIPSSIGYLSKLTVLDLGRNNLTGPIPDSFENLKKVKYVELSFNPLNATLNPKLSNCTILDTLSIQNASIYGPIPTSFQEMTHLSKLQLDNNSLSGELPPDFGNCCEHGLNTAILLAGNHLSGAIPVEYFTKFPDMVILDLSNNFFSGNLPSYYKTNLSNNNLYNNFLTGSLPKTIFEIPTLSELDIHSNSLNGTVPLNLFNTSMSKIDLSDNNFWGPIPPLRMNNDGMISGPPILNISNNKLTGAIPPELFLSSTIETLDLRSNELSGPLLIPLQVPETSLLRLVYLSENQIHGSLPDTLDALNQLGRLQLDNNFLSGQIPSVIGNIKTLQILSLSNNNLSGDIPSELGNLPVLSYLRLRNNSLSNSIPTNIGNLSSLNVLDLSDNRLSGRIPSNLGNLSVLFELNLSKNELTGSIPSKLSGLSELKSVDFSDNRLSGRIPRGNLSVFDASVFTNNSGLCGEPLNSCPVKLLPGVIAGIVLGSFCMLIIVLFIGVYIIYRLRRSGPDGGELKFYHKLPVSLTYKKILRATDNWSATQLLGTGGFGSVYKALLSDGQTTVAIKRLSQASSQGKRELQAEIETLGRIKHRNIVKLIASYVSKREALLIYEFFPGGDLAGFLKIDNEIRQNWNIRYKLLLGSAKGLKYLHHNNDPAVIHRDIKPQNILLDDDFEAHIADFGLAREIQLETNNGSHSSEMSTLVCGTVGYMPMEYFHSRKVSFRTDIYAFGVVILEVITGKRPTDKTLTEESLPSWVSKMWTQGNALDTVDPKLSLKPEEVAEVLGTIKVGLMCTSVKPECRPTMAEVVLLLERITIFRNIAVVK